jgi:guanylate kinase
MMKNKKRTYTNIVVISGPSGSGKSTLICRMMERHPEIIFSTSHTTRAIRGKEVDGIDYHFVTKEEFLAMTERGEFVEWAEVYGNYYGTSFKEIEDKLSSEMNRVLVLDIDVQGAINIQREYPDALFIQVVPPSLEELKQRLVGREKKIDSVIENRLAIAVQELKQYDVYDYTVINDELDEAFAVLDAVYTAFMNKTERHETFMKKLVSEKRTGN